MAFKPKRKKKEVTLLCLSWTLVKDSIFFSPSTKEKGKEKKSRHAAKPNRSL